MCGERGRKEGEGERDGDQVKLPGISIVGESLHFHFVLMGAGSNKISKMDQDLSRPFPPPPYP